MALGRRTEHGDRLVDRDGDRRGGITAGIVRVDGVGRRRLIGVWRPGDGAVPGVELHPVRERWMGPSRHDTTSTEILEDGSGDDVPREGVTL